MAYLVDRSGDKAGDGEVALAYFDGQGHLPELGPLPSHAASADEGETSFYRARGKRLFDLTLGSLMLLAAAPVILFLAAIVALDGGKPLFAHKRIGKGGKPFKCLKIRSMRLDAEAQLQAILATDPAAAAEWAEGAKLTNDPRVTQMGAFLRRSSLDELPQLINVVKGEMSLVGPRPVIAEELPRYGRSVASYYAVKPGLTGPWQVDGRNAINYDGRVALDVAYARSHDFQGDLGIVFRTGLAMLKLTGQ